MVAIIGYVSNKDKWWKKVGNHCSKLNIKITDDIFQLVTFIFKRLFREKEIREELKREISRNNNNFQMHAVYQRGSFGCRSCRDLGWFFIDV